MSSASSLIAGNYCKTSTNFFGAFLPSRACHSSAFKRPILQWRQADGKKDHQQSVICNEMPMAERKLHQFGLDTGGSVSARVDGFSWSI